MNDTRKHVPGSARQGLVNTDGDTPKRPHTLRDRWESIRYGPAGRVLGYGLAFTVVFLLISLLLWLLESNHF
jgi:hypothetical protein